MISDSLTTMEKINVIFHCICIIAVFIYAVINIYSYWRNEDLCEITFKTFHTKKDAIYPSLSMCFNSPFNINKMSLKDLNVSSYENYLLGRTHDKRNFVDIDYDNVTIKLDDFLIKAYARNKELVRDEIPLREHVTEQSWGWYWGLMKCFKFNVPFRENVKMSALRVEFKNAIFPKNGQRPSDGWDSGGMHIFFHYPNQFSKSFPTNKRFWQNRKSNRNSNHIRFYHKEMEVLTKRQKRDEQCLENEYASIDDWLIYHIMDTIKCRPPYWSNKLISNTSFPVCDSKEQLYEAVDHFFNFFYGNKENNSPCIEIVNLGIDYEESEDRNVTEGATRISLYYRSNTFKEIKQMRAYTGMMLLGNVGGFFGVLLGYAFVQIPGFINMICFDFMTNKVSTKPIKSVYPVV